MSRLSIFLMLFLSCAFCQAKDLTIDDVYQNFNMRSISSSFGQRLRYYCQSYPKDYFPSQYVAEKKSTQITLDNNDDVWVLAIVGKNRISISNKIKTGSYNTVVEHDVFFNPEAADWRTKETFINVPPECVNYKPEKTPN